MPISTVARLDLCEKLAAVNAGAMSVLRRPIHLLVAIGICCCAGGAAGQTTTASLQGVVRDATLAITPGVTITVRSPDTGVTRVVVTDAAGRYYVPALPVGRYNLTAELAGFRKEQWSDVRLEVGQEAVLDLTLQVGIVTDEITVTGRPAAIEPTKTAIGRVVRREQIDTLPLISRTVDNLALLVPGVVPQSIDSAEPVTGGAQPRGSIEILVDGVSNKGTTLGNVRSYGSPDAVEEFQVLTAQYSAEFGNASGIVLQTITRSGTNRLQGRAYYYQRDDDLDARNAFATSSLAFEQKQGGGWLGGPIVVDRAHFFASAEFTEGVGVATVTAGPEPGDVAQPFRGAIAFAKVDHQLTPRNRLVARVAVDRSLRENRGVGGNRTASWGYDFDKRDSAFVGELSTIFSSRAQNELRVQYSDSFMDARVADPNAYTIIRKSSYSGKPSGFPRGGTEVRLQVVDSFSYVAKQHHLKAGFDISRIGGSEYWWSNYPGTWRFATDDPYDTHPTQFTMTDGPTYSDIHAADVSAFAQDSWRVHPALTLNVGLRYDAYWMTGLDLQKVNLSPRLGLAWDPLGDGKTAIRGGFGVFHNSILGNIADVSGPALNSQRIQIRNPGYPDPFSGGTLAYPLNVVRAQDNMAVPQTYSTTVGVQREVGADLTVSVDYANLKGRQLIRQVETNPTMPPDWVRADPSRGYVREEQSVGYSDYQALWVTVRKRWGARAQIDGSYTLASGNATHDVESQLTQQDDRYPDDSYGYTVNDERHRVAVSGIAFLPWGLQAGAVVYARSGRPVNVTTGTDINKNGSFLDRPNLAPGVTLGSDAMKDRSSYLTPPVGTLGDLPRNAGRGPAFWQLDVRVSKVILLGKARVEILAEAFNVDNHVNLSNWVGDLASADFGRSLEAEPARQVQLGVRVTF
jgi:hypothetical protein